MFGVRKSINLTDNAASEVNVSSKKTDNKESGDDSKYIYYTESESDDKFISQLEIYIKPNNYPDKKILIIAKKGINFEDLYRQIEENFKSISEFKTISNLSIKHYSKSIGEERIKLPLTGPVEKYLKSGDIIFCDILSEEIWMGTFFKLEVNNFRKVLKVEYKIPKRLNFKHIKFILLKAGISLFYEEIKNNNLDNSFNYYLKDILFNKKKKKILKNEFGKEYKYEVFVNMHFEIFEELIHEQLQTNELKKTEKNYFRFNEYSNFSFEELISSEKFAPELNAIKDISREFLTSQYNDIKTTFAFYNPKIPETFESFIISEDVSSMSELAELSEENEASNFISEDSDISIVGENKLINSTSSSSIKSKYKPDANLIIIATFLYNIESRSSSFSSLKEDINFNNNINNNNNDVLITNSELDMSMDDNKLNNSMQKLNFNDNPLKDSLIHHKNANKSLLISDKGIKMDESNQDLVIKRDVVNENIIFLDEDSLEENKKKKKKKHKSKKKEYQVLIKEFNQENDCSGDLYDLFNQRTFLEKVKLNYKLIYNKKLIERLRVPESRNIEDVDRNFFKFLLQRDKKKRLSIFKYHKKLIAFLIIALLYFLVVIVCINIDLFSMNFN